MKKRITTLFTVFFVVSLFMFGCDSSKKSSSNITIVETEASASDGLDLQAVGAILEKASSTEEFEKKLNESNGINNLDLDDDENVDYITVTEYETGTEGVYGFSLTVEVTQGEVQEIANITMKKEADGSSNVDVAGNENIYGSGYVYHSHYNTGAFLLGAYLFGYHPLYVSPYHYGYYPGWYHPYVAVSPRAYSSRSTTIRQTSKTVVTKSGKSSIKAKKSSPNKGKVANKGIKKSLKNPTKTQKQFRARNTNKKIKTGGFGKKKSTSGVGSTTTKKSPAFGKSFSKKSGFGKKSSSKSSSWLKTKRSSSFGRSSSKNSFKRKRR